MTSRERKGFWLDIRNISAFFVIGLLNNLSFVAVNSSAKVLCGDFHMEHWVGSILFFNVSFSFFVRIAHSAFLLNVPFTIRMIITSVMYLLGLIGMANSQKVGFWFVLVSVVLVGTSSNLGESILVGYMKLFPPNQICGFSSGTGFAGIAGAGLIAFFQWLHTSIKTQYFILAPVVVIYFITYLLWIKIPKNEDIQSQRVTEEEGIKKDINQYDIQQQQQSEDDEDNTYIKFQRKLSGEEMEESNKQKTATFAPKSTGIGVFISRSSLYLIKIKKLHFISPRFVWFLFAHMIFVGLMGGGMYVNVFYLILDLKMHHKEKELATNIVMIFITVGITLAAVSCLIVRNFWLK
ncbi:MAG: putative Cln3 protein [Streblomastix strix]|uniref:Putative Cln3 protein n=1 Tax=Streblomastix strix TaxID=222440 RepID=A0A5J4VDX4_9EUKA|nr:MAG: putative Cln3 protein [Streblomastix strix]